MASPEDGIGATSSAPAAELLTCAAPAAAADHLVAGAALDGGTHAAQDASLRCPGIDTTFVPVGRTDAFAAATRPAARAFWRAGAVRRFVSGAAAGNLSQVA
jgi:O-acetylhomoserine (thiol)-lyase